MSHKNTLFYLNIILILLFSAQLAIFIGLNVYHRTKVTGLHSAPTYVRVTVYPKTKTTGLYDTPAYRELRADARNVCIINDDSYAAPETIDSYKFSYVQDQKRFEQKYRKMAPTLSDMEKVAC